MYACWILLRADGRYEAAVCPGPGPGATGTGFMHGWEIPPPGTCSGTAP